MHSTGIFPAEVWAHILVLLDVHDVLNYQSVCKDFYQLTKSVATLRLRLELNAAGYVEARNYRKDISNEQRLSILREHIRRRRTLSPSRVDTLWQEPSNMNPHHAMILRQIQGQSLVFSEGVLARRMIGSVTKHQLEIVQLPSPNHGTEMRCWTLNEKGMCFGEDFWIQPSLDLLVLAKTDILLGGNSNLHDWHIEANYEFHLRTLSGNDKHPDALEPVLRLPNQPPNEVYVVEFIGRLMLLQLPVATTSKLVIWDWTTGSMLLDKTLEYRGIGFAVVSEDLIAIPHASTDIQPHGSNPCLGSFNVFRLKYDGSQLDLVLVRRFELSGASNTLISDPRTKTMYRATRVALGFDPEPAHATTTDIPIMSPPKLFETSNKERILQLKVALALEEDESDYQPNSGYPQLGPANFGTGRDGPVPSPLFFALCIPIKTILDKLSSVSKDGATNHVVPWSEWGSKTRWVHAATLRGGLTAAGSRCVFPRYNAQGAPGPQCIASILEFHPNLQFVQNPHDLQMENESESGKENHDGVSILGSAPLPLGFDSCFDDASQSAALPYTMAEFNHEVIANERPRKMRPVIMTSEEHMVIVQQTPQGHTKGVAVLTF